MLNFQDNSKTTVSQYTCQESLNKPAAMKEAVLQVSNFFSINYNRLWLVTIYLILVLSKYLYADQDVTTAPRCSS